MTNNEYDIYVSSLAHTLEQVLVFKLFNTTLKSFANAGQYKRYYEEFRHGACNNRAMFLFQKIYHIDRDEITPIIGKRVEVEGIQRRVLNDVISCIEEKSEYLWHIGKRNTKFKSGKKFYHKSFWLINVSKIEDMFIHQREWNYTKSDHYDEVVHHIIHQHILKTGKRMTRQEIEQYQKEYDEGKHSMNLKDYEKALIKEKEKAERRILTLAKKAAIEAVQEYRDSLKKNEDLEVKVQTLEAENRRLRAINREENKTDIVDDLCVDQSNDFDIEDLFEEPQRINHVPTNEVVIHAKPVEPKPVQAPLMVEKDPGGLDKLFKILQYEINQQTISADAANLAMVQMGDTSRVFKPHPRGFSALDGKAHAKDRLYLYTTILNEYKINMSDKAERYFNECVKSAKLDIENN